MAHRFDHDRPEHRVHHLNIHTSHGTLDEKYDKGNRAPIAAQLPPNTGFEMPELDQNTGEMPAEG